jgi:tetratricopeptide (TPR) repeat protein
MADLGTLWSQRRDFLRDRDERRADDIELRIRALKDDLQIDNLFSIGAALVRESQDALAGGTPALARKRCKQATEFAPALPAAWGCLARSLLSEDLGQVREAFAAWVEMCKAVLNDPRESRAWIANAGTVALLGLLLASVAFVVLLFARYAQLYLHDVHHLFPGGARPWQTRLLAAVLLLLPILLQLGPVPLLFTALAACALYCSTVEVGTAIVVLGLFAAAPFAAEGLARLAAFGGPAADVWLIESSEGSTAALGRLQRRAEAQSEFAVAFSLARRAKREGDLPTAEQLYKKALEAGGTSGEALAAGHNNLGNVYLLEGDAQKAIAQYQQAIDLQEASAPAHFNLSRAYSGGGVEQLEKVQTEQARAFELDRPAIDAFPGYTLQVNRKANKFVMDVPLPPASLEPLAAIETGIAAPVGDEAKAALGGPLPPALAPLLPLAAAALFLTLHLLRARLKPSGRCDRCGREVCKRCDPDARPTEALCAQCVNVFVRRSNVDPTERIRKEVAVHLYQQRRTFILRGLGVLSGAGHVLLGYPIRGLVFMALTGCLGASCILWRGVAHDPVAVRAVISPLRVGLTLAVFILVYGLCLRDLIAKQRQEGP